MIKPIVSVIIPTYNRSDILPRAIQSVLNQTFRDFELIVVDDASNDKTETVVRSYNHPSIVYLRHEKNSGAPSARNTGIKNAQGEYVAFLDSDNEWLPERLEKQVDLFSRVNERVGVVYANNKVIDEVNKTETEWAFGLRGNLYKEFLQRPFMDFITPLIKKVCLDKIGLMDEQVPSYQEWDTFLRISKYYEFDFVPETLAIYYFHKGNTYSQDALRVARGYRYVFEKHKDEMREILGPKVLIEHHGNLSSWYKRGHAYARMAKNAALFWYYKKFS